MKRCPQCNRVETDEGLKFCRIDGTTLVNDSSSTSSEMGTAQLGVSPDASEVHTSILPHRTDANINRGTASTTVLPAQGAPGVTRELNKPKRRTIVSGIVAFIVLAMIIGGYFYFSRKSNTAIQSIAVLPFENRSGSSDTDYLSDG